MTKSSDVKYMLGCFISVSGKRAGGMEGGFSSRGSLLEGE